MVNAFITVAIRPLRRRSERQSSRTGTFLCDARLLHSSGSGTDRRTHKATNAGSTPAKKTARQPRVGSTMAVTPTANISPIAQDDCINANALPRCSARHVSAMSAAPVPHSPPKPRPRTKRNIASCSTDVDKPHAPLARE